MYLDRLNPLFIKLATNENKSKKKTFGDGGFHIRTNPSEIYDNNSSLISHEHASSRRAKFGSHPDSVNEDSEKPVEDEIDVDWRGQLRKDDSSLIKCHNNIFGSKDYNVDLDKQALTQHVNRILNSNLQTPTAHPKPYLIKKASEISLSKNRANGGVSPDRISSRG